MTEIVFSRRLFLEGEKIVLPFPDEIVSSHVL